MECTYCEYQTILSFALEQKQLDKNVYKRTIDKIGWKRKSMEKALVWSLIWLLHTSNDVPNSLGHTVPFKPINQIWLKTTDPFHYRCDASFIFASFLLLQSTFLADKIFTQSFKGLT